jgi:acyl-CoA thioester hydrolase
MSPSCPPGWQGLAESVLSMNTKTEKAAPERRSAYPAFRTITTRWMDNDVYGHVNNVVYYSWFDTAVNAWLIERGVLDIHGGQTIGLVIETQCNYFGSLAFPQTIEAGVRVARLGNSSVRYEVGLFAQGEEHAAAQGHFVHVYVDRQTRRPVPLPGPLRAALETLTWNP